MIGIGQFLVQIVHYIKSLLNYIKFYLFLTYFWSFEPALRAKKGDEVGLKTLIS